jgi:cytochrome P450
MTQDATQTAKVTRSGFQLVADGEWPDPHPSYHRMRAETPILAVPELDMWVLTRYADCERVLRDPGVSTDPSSRRFRPEEEGLDLRSRLTDSEIRVLLFMDPPDHTRLRRLVSAAFTPRTVERLRSHVAELVDAMLTDAVARAADGDGTFDLIAEVGYLLPVTVICELLGVPVADRDRFAPWSSDASRMLDGDIDEATAMAGIGHHAVRRLLQRAVRGAPGPPGDDLVSRLLAVEEEGDRLTHGELLSTVLLLFVAGHETTTNLIGNGTVALMRHRDQWDRLVADPGGLAAPTVEEVLRWDGPVHVTARTATRDMVVGEGDEAVTVEAGQGMLCALAAANRDPARFPDPDRLDIGRADNQHLTFSHGVHYCLGAALARVEGQETFAALARRFPHLELAAEPVHRDHFVLRGYREIVPAPDPDHPISGRR